MKIYKCDSCKKTHDNNHNSLIIIGLVVNNLNKFKQKGGVVDLYFCSRSCVENYFFVNSHNLTVNYLYDIANTFKYASNNDLTIKQIRFKFIRFLFEKYNSDVIKAERKMVLSVINEIFPLNR